MPLPTNFDDFPILYFDADWESYPWADGAFKGLGWVTLIALVILFAAPAVFTMSLTALATFNLVMSIVSAVLAIGTFLAYEFRNIVRVAQTIFEMVAKAETEGAILKPLAAIFKESSFLVKFALKLTHRAGGDTSLARSVSKGYDRVSEILLTHGASAKHHSVRKNLGPYVSRDSLDNFKKAGFSIQDFASVKVYLESRRLGIEEAIWLLQNGASLEGDYHYLARALLLGSKELAALLFSKNYQPSEAEKLEVMLAAIPLNDSEFLGDLMTRGFVHPTLRQTLEAGNLSVATWLFTHGADFFQDEAFMYLLAASQMPESSALIALIKAQNYQPRPDEYLLALKQIIARDEDELLEQLIPDDFDVCFPDEDGMSPLELALDKYVASDFQATVFEELLERISSTDNLDRVPDRFILKVLRTRKHDLIDQVSALYKDFSIADRWNVVQAKERRTIWSEARAAREREQQQRTKSTGGEGSGSSASGSPDLRGEDDPAFVV